MVSISNFIDFTFMKLRHAEIGQGVCILTFKKDRKITVVKEEFGYAIHQDGFDNDIHFAKNENELRKTLKHLAKREFPRSSMLHFNLVNKYKG